MGEDRRPNVAGRHPPEAQDQAKMDREQIELDAKTLADRRGADGHKGSSPAEVRKQE